MRLLPRLLLLLIVVSKAAVLAELPEKVRNAPSAAFREGVGIPHAMVDLPAHVAAPEGKLTLWADFANAKDDVPLYLVNQTNQAHEFDSQDGDIYIKLHGKDASGSWQRAQTHLSSWCGNSYHSVALPPRHFFAFSGFKSAAGEKRAVRYAMTRGDALVSNEGVGLVSPKDLEAAPLDVITYWEIPYHFWSALDPGNLNVPNREAAMQGHLEAVRALAWLPRNEPAVAEVRKLQEVMRVRPPTDAREELLKAIDGFFSTLDKPRLQHGNLMRQCLACITNDPASDMTMSEHTAWCLIEVPEPGTSKGDVFSIPATWRGAIGPAVAFLKKEGVLATMAGRNAHKMLSQTWIVDALISHAEVGSWIASGNDVLLQLGADALVRRLRTSELVKLAWDLRPPAQIQVIKAMARPMMAKTLVQPGLQGDDDLRFWKHCLETMPLETAVALWSEEFLKDRNPFAQWVHEPLHQFFEKEADRGTADHDLTHEEASRLGTALTMLASCRKPEDDAILNALLKHGGHTPSAFATKADDKRYVLRPIVRQLIDARQHPVPPGSNPIDPFGTPVSVLPGAPLLPVVE